MRVHKRFSCMLLVAIMFISVFASCGSAAAAAKPPAGYPSKPITVIVSFAAGGGTDIGSRILLKYAERFVGRPLNVINIDGGGSEIGVTQLKNSPNDGYTIGGFNSASIMLTARRKAQYDPVADFEPICLQVNDPRLFAFKADDNRFNTLDEMVTYAKANPGQLLIGTSGAGTTGHFSIAAFNHYAGVDVKAVHFGGAGESKAAFLGGHVDGIAQTIGEVTQMVEEGQAKVVGILSEERFPQFPDAQTFKEIGIDLVMNSARGYVAPKGTPMEIVEFLADCFRQAMEDPDYLRDMQNLGLPSVYMPPSTYKPFIAAEKKAFDEMCSTIVLK